MNKIIICLILVVSISLIDNVNAVENELVEYEVYYNDQVTTVYDADLKVGEPATIKAVVYLKKNVDVSTGLTATGFEFKNIDQPFKVIDGPSVASTFKCQIIIGTWHNYKIKLFQ